jgi:N-acetylglucosaminylphosphatidylinositol deacetylase
MYTQGNSEGLGAVRVAELHRAAVILGVETSPHDSISPSQVCKGGSRVEAIDHAELQDGMRASWPPQAVRDLVMDRVRSFRPDIVSEPPFTWHDMNVSFISAISFIYLLGYCIHVMYKVVTFDEGGVSGHPNHIDTYRGVQLCARDYNAERGGKTDYPSILFLKLHTTCLVRKYAGAMDALLTAAVLQSSCWPLDRAPDRSNDDDNDVILVLNPDVPIVYAAMAQHRSQFVWYRRAFVLLSRYTYINTFRRIR